MNFILLQRRFDASCIIFKLQVRTIRITIGGPKMSGNFVRERQRIVYIYNIHKVGNLISSDEHMTFVKHKIHRSWN